MKPGERKHVFISYSWKDASAAEQVRNSIPSEFEVWFDKERISPGESISHAIQEGLNASDYYLLLISENSNESIWVQREIATAFELSREKKLSVVPAILQGSAVPFAFKGLLTIDFRTSFSDGLKKLRDFFQSQAAIIDDIEPRHLMLKSDGDVVRKRLACNESLRDMSLGDLRYLVAERLSIEDVEVIWFDLFGRRMADEVQVRNLALSCVELIDRSRRTDVIVDLLDKLCRNFPYISKGL